MGMVYLVGAGPGDTKLITLRGLEVIRIADAIIYDFLANQQLLAFARTDAELIYVGKQASRHELPQDRINTLLARKASEKGVVVRLKGGDPFIFGRGGEEALYLKHRGIPFEIVPGVTSAVAVPAYAGIPLTDRNHASTVAFVTGHEDERKDKSAIRWPELAQGVDTLVFLMGVKNLGGISEKLIRAGRSPETMVSVIQWGTLPQQRVVTGSLATIAALAQQSGLKPPCIIVVGDVVNMRKDLEWFEKKPLYGKKIIVTRAARQAARLGELLSDKGAEVHFVPVIEIAAIEPNPPLSAAIDNLRDYDFLIFTSTNSVSAFFSCLRGLGRDSRYLGAVKIAAIGPATASALEARGIVADLLPSRYTSAGIAETLISLPIKGRRFLLPRAEEAGDVLVEFIAGNGGICDVLPVYRTLSPGGPAPFPSGAGIITFTSSSTVRNFISLYGREALDTAIVASIGPVTSATLKTYGVEPDIEAQRSDVPGLVDAIEEYVCAGKGHSTHGSL